MTHDFRDVNNEPSSRLDAPPIGKAVSKKQSYLGRGVQFVITVMYIPHNSNAV